MSRLALVVDDSATMRQMVALVLTEAGFQVVQAADGRDGLIKLDAKAPALIITDLNMPVMDGLTFIKEVRTRSAHKFTPVLMLTTEAGTTQKEAGKLAGATGWLVKPFDPETLIKVVKKVLP